jgi:hypothetical protein
LSRFFRNFTFRQDSAAYRNNRISSQRKRIFQFRSSSHNFGRRVGLFGGQSGRQSARKLPFLGRLVEIGRDQRVGLQTDLLH